MEYNNQSLLEGYFHAQLSVIGEHSVNMYRDWTELFAEIANYAAALHLDLAFLDDERWRIDEYPDA